MSTMVDRRDRTSVWGVYESPLGPLTIEVSPRGISGLSFPGRKLHEGRRARGAAALSAAMTQLGEYFAGVRREFELELDLVGTELQLAIWAELQRIPYGTTISYSELARRVGRADVVRAVGGCVGQTPVPIVVPCHRVIGKDGSLTGYGGGLHRKRALLELEQRTSGAPPAAWAFRQLSLV